MSIEGGGSGGGASGGAGGAGIGSAISVGPSMSVGIEAGSFMGAAPAVAGGISAASFLEGPMPISSVGGFEPIGASLGGLEPMGKIDLSALDLKGGSLQPEFSLAGEILFQSQQELNEGNAVLEAESIISQAQKPEINDLSFLPLREDVPEWCVPKQSSSENDLTQIAASVVSLLPRNDGIVETAPYSQLPSWEVIVPQEAPIIDPMPLGFAQPGTKTIVEETEAVAQRAWESHPITQAEEIASKLDEEEEFVSLPVATLEQVKEEVLVEEKTEDAQPKESQEEYIDTDRKIIVEDGEVVAQRKIDIKVVAVSKAQELATKLGLKKIPGRFIALFAPKEYIGVRSQVIKEKGPDGSYEETIEALAGAGEFESVTAARNKVEQVIAEKKPGRYGKDGTPLAFEHVARILKHRIFKSVQPQFEVVKRVTKKKVEATPEQKVVQFPSAQKIVKPEPSIRDFESLAKVFEKAA